MNSRSASIRKIAAAYCLIAVTAMVGCKGPRLYHSPDSVVPGPGTNFHTAFIEFDDQGDLWEPGQISNAVQVIRSNNPVFLVTYIHGWKNNADFHTTITFISQTCSMHWQRNCRSAEECRLSVFTWPGEVTRLP